MAHSAGPNAAYVVFKVHNIDNTQGKVNFAFDPSKMYVNVSSHPHMDSSLSLAHFIGVFQLVPTNIPMGQVVGLDGFSVAVVPTASANGSVEANQTSYNLAYDAPDFSRGSGRFSARESAAPLIIQGLQPRVPSSGGNVGAEGPLRSYRR